MPARTTEEQSKSKTEEETNSPKSKANTSSSSSRAKAARHPHPVRRTVRLLQLNHLHQTARKIQTPVVKRATLLIRRKQYMMKMIKWYARSKTLFRRRTAKSA